MKARIQKWGNSMAIRIPKVMLEEMGIGENGGVEIHVIEGELRIRPVEPTRRYTLEELVQGMHKSTQHGLLLDDAPQGKEVW